MPLSRNKNNDRKHKDLFLDSIQLHWSLCLSLCQVPHCLHCCFIVNLKSGTLSPPKLFFFCKIVWAILGLCILNLACYFLQKKISYRNFNKDFIKSAAHFGDKLPQCGEKCFKPQTWHVSSFIYILIQQCFMVSVYRSHASCIKFIPMCIILLDAILSRIVFLNLFSNYSLLV